MKPIKANGMARIHFKSFVIIEYIKVTNIKIKPPPLGVDLVWELLEFGLSSIYLDQKGINSNKARIDIKRKKKKYIFFIL